VEEEVVEEEEVVVKTEVKEAEVRRTW